MKLYGLALYTVHEVIDWYATREEAEAALRTVIADEPDCEGIVSVEAVEFDISSN